MLLDGRPSICALYFIKMVALIKGALTINSNCPTVCQCTSPNRVNCSASGITDTLFQQIDLRTTHLDISRNNLPQLSEHLALFENLIHLNASFNRILALHRHLFSRMHSLKSVDVSHNQIRKLSDINGISVFSSNSKLQFLNLSSNPLASFGDENEDTLYSESLLDLDLSQCQLNHIQGAFALLNLPRLQSLNLSHNLLSRLDGFVSDSLVSLDLSANNLQFLRSDVFDDLTRLRELRLANNKHLSDHYFKLFSRSLTFLDASFCSLSTNYASDLPEIHTLILRGNLISILPANSFENNTKLEYLDLSENRIRILDEFTFQGAEALRNLDLSSNTISALPKTMLTFTPLLQRLNLSNTEVVAFPNFTAPSLRVLDLSSTKIESWFSNSLLHLPNLQFLNLSYTYLAKLPENVSSYSLQSLDVSHTRLTKITLHHLQKLPALTELNLSGNGILYIKNNTFFANNRLSSLIMEDNPWRCDCVDENFHIFWNYLRRANITNMSTLVCQFPDNVTGWRWEDACSEAWDLSGSGQSMDAIVVFIIVCVLFMSGLIACIVGVRETIIHRKNRRSDEEANARNEGDEVGENEREHTGTVTGEPTERGNEAAVRVSIGKLTQLPSYDEALLLPKRDIDEGPSDKSKKRQSSTQTDESILTLLKQVKEDRESAAETAEQDDDDEMANTSTSTSDQVRRNSWNEIQYINIRPLKVQCTNL